MKIYVPGDSAAISVGADDVAAAIAHKVTGASIIRNGSRGALWLEPMIEVETEKGRVALDRYLLKILIPWLLQISCMVVLISYLLVRARRLSG